MPIGPELGHIQSPSVFSGVEDRLHLDIDDSRLRASDDWRRDAKRIRRTSSRRPNWLFVGSDDGARANAVFTSLLASCRMHDIEPWADLRDLLCLLPRHPKHRVLELAPAYWHAAQQHPDIRLRLDRDPFRSAELALAAPG